MIGIDDTGYGPLPVMPEVRGGGTSSSPSWGLHQLSLRNAADLLRGLQVSPTELTRACLDQIVAWDTTVGAFSCVDGESALDAARELTEVGARRPERTSMWGIPISVKDMIDVRELPTRGGSSLLSAVPPAEGDAACVAKLRAAGSVILGKTHTHEFAYGVVTPQTRNPRDPARTAGGSSGGAAAAVASCQAFASVGTDTGGSVRIPAALCGVAGLKTRRSSISTDGVLPLSPMLDSVGFLARSADDLALVWECFQRPVHGREARLKVGVVARSQLGFLEPDVLRSWQQAVEVFSGVPGIEIVEIRPPDFDEWTAWRIPPLLRDVLTVHRDRGWYPACAGQYSERMRGALESAENLGVGELSLAFRNVSLLVDSFMRSLDRVDVALLPTTPITAPLLDGAEAQSAELLRLCAPINWCSLASVSVPSSPASSGLPVGIQFVARDEWTALRAARSFEAAQATTG